jgi:hypothetical protein
MTGSLQTGQKESDIQAAFVRWLDLHAPRFPSLAFFYAIPNGGLRNRGVAGQLRGQGVRAGVPDMHLPFPSADAKKHGLWIEFKSATGRLSPAQETWSKVLGDGGHEVWLCRSWSEAANITIDYLGLKLQRFA